MSAAGIVTIVLIAAAIFALVYGKFRFTSVHDTKVGPIAMKVNEKQTVNVPEWAGWGAIVIGGLLLFAGRKS
ncbi:MAG TPA: hypothetical protein VFA36_10685 [Burkholderiales bacterium]|jgi:hypothetical protein|nr:hypothetical protein [Burkholderiales bacterium]